jgi:hypothetical protein
MRSRAALLPRLALARSPRVALRFVPRRNLSTANTAATAERSAADRAREEALTQMAFEEQASSPAWTAAKGAMWAAGLGVVGFSIYMLYNEMNPTATSPTSVFNDAFEVVRNHAEVVGRLGSPVNGYGRDLGGSREGRRNFYDHDTYVDDDGVWRTRIKFDLEGPNGKAVVYAEKMRGAAPQEFVYVILEHVMRGRRDSIALQDNRKVLTRPELQEKLATRLTKSGTVLMGHSTCQWTKRQIEEFGEYAGKLQVIMCDAPENRDLCANAQLKGYPTWRVKDQNIPGGFKTLEELQALARML